MVLWFLWFLVVFDGLWLVLVALGGPCNGSGNGLKMAEKSGRQTSKTVAGTSRSKIEIHYVRAVFCLLFSLIYFFCVAIISSFF